MHKKHKQDRYNGDFFENSVKTLKLHALRV